MPTLQVCMNAVQMCKWTRRSDEKQFSVSVLTKVYHSLTVLLCPSYGLLL